MKSARPSALLLLIFILLIVACDNNTPVPTPTVTNTVAPPTTLPSTNTPPPATPTSEPPTEPPTVPPTPSPATQSPTPGSSSEGCAALAAQAPQDGMGDPLYPKLGNAGYDALHYTLDLSVDVGSNVLSGTTTIRARASKDLAAFNLDFESLPISSLTVNGTPAPHGQADAELSITPTLALKAGETFTVTVAYKGEPNSAPGDNVPGAAEYALGWSHYSGGVVVASEPSGAASFYPVNDHPCDKATYTFRITAPKPYTVAANGVLKDRKDNGSTVTYLFETRDPMASYLVTIDIAEFDLKMQDGPGGLPLRNYFEKTIDAETREYFNHTAEMIDYFSKMYGPYPFDVYGVVVLDDPLGFALEAQTLSLFGRKVGTSRVEAEQVVAHELSHMWFGDSVSLTQWRDIWLNEGFASMSEWLWLEHTEGKAFYDDYVHGQYNYAHDNDLFPPGNPPADDLFNPAVYVRGGLTLHALRKKVGDDAFFKTLQTYTSRYHNSNATTQDFISVAEEVSGTKLGDLFNSWLYGETLPPLP